MSKLFLLKSAFHALFKNKIRTVLTVLGISVGIIAVIVVTSAGQSLKSFVLAQVDVFGSNLIQIEIKIPSAKKGHTESATTFASGVSITTLKTEDAEAIAKLKNVEAVSPGITSQELISYKDQIKKVLALGYDENLLVVNKFNLASGRVYTKEENDGMAKVVVIGSKVQEKLFGNEETIDKVIKINRINYKVVGVLAKQGTTGFMDLDSAIFLPVKTLQKGILGVDHVIFITLTVKDQKLADDTADEISNLLAQRHNITDPSKYDFSVTTMAEARKSIDTIFDGLTILLLALVGVSLVIGGVGIMNIMYVTVSERTYEIGLRKAVGARIKDIFWQFLFEALIMTLTSGFAGVVVGLFLSYLISFIAQSQGFILPFSISFSGVFLALGFSAAVGLIFGLTPARRASLLDPVEALRRE